MAIMHPTDITKRKHVPSEESFFNACKEQLSDKYHVFFSVRWYSVENGKRIDSECDFLVFNPDYGFLCIECKGGNGIYVDDDGDWFLKDFDEDRKLRRSPYKQSEESMRFFKKYYEDELETFYPGIYGHAVVFPRFIVPAPITVESPLELTIDMESMRNLPKKIVEIFRYFGVSNGGRSLFMSPESRKKFINIINKRIALSIAAGALIEDKERELNDINQTQDVIIDLLVHYPRAFIIGGAGTGKTWIGIKKIKRCILDGKKALYLCCNKVLAEYVRKQINNDDADVYSVEDYAYRILGDEAITAPEINGCKEYAELIGSKPFVQKYDLVVVDEAQDFTEDWAFCANLLVKDEGSLYVFFDESQNVFSRSFGDKFYISEEPFVLRYNIRNTSNIYHYTQDRTTLGQDTLVNQIEGVEPDVRRITRKHAVISFVDSVINKLVNKEGVSPEKIVILSNRELEKSVFSNIMYVSGYELVKLGSEKPSSIIYSTVHDFKGLESDIVIYVNHTYRTEPKTDMINAIQYTAMTRARFYLYVIDFEENV